MKIKQKGDNEERPVKVSAGKVTLEGILGVPKSARGVVLFAHGSGSGRHSPRNRYVAEVFRKVGLATLLIDLLTPAEEAVDLRTMHLRFNIELLAERLVGATDWIRRNAETQKPRTGYFGASTGAAAALVAAVERSDIIDAIVSRGGRPDLAGAALPRVKAPTLLIVGGKDIPIIGINQDALNQLYVEKELVIIPGATHLFEELGALDQVAQLAANWFLRHLGGERLK